MPDLLCLKCDSKWDSQYLERKQVRACPLCKEPGLRYMDDKGNATDETWPKEDAG
jgi:uncharacterized protein YbaR (Trm112 family)